jgi:16S rRNA (guanine527-N7)-methyltransferase
MHCWRRINRLDFGIAAITDHPLMESADSQLDRAVEDSLAAVLARHGVELPESQRAELDRYRELLWSWNERLNLTRHTDFEKFVTRDVVDSLALADCLDEGEMVLDIGTGGGVPGVVLAITRPDLSVTLCESVAKRARAVEQIVAELGLPASVVHARAEELLDQQSFDTLVARAVAPLYKMAGWLAPHTDAFRRLLVIKGRNWSAERHEARQRGELRPFDLRRVEEYATPGSDAMNVILQITPKQRD